MIRFTLCLFHPPGEAKTNSLLGQPCEVTKLPYKTCVDQEKVILHDELAVTMPLIQAALSLWLCLFISCTYTVVFHGFACVSVGPASERVFDGPEWENPLQLLICRHSQQTPITLWVMH